MLVWALACTPPPPVVATQAPAPADLLQVRLAGPDLGDHIEVMGALRGTPVRIDDDAAPDDGWPFLVELLTDGEVVWRGSRREPVQAREFIARLELGLDLFAVLPELGDVTLAVPAGVGSDVRFSRLEAGRPVALGTFALDDIPELLPYEVLDVVPIREVAPADQALDFVFVADGYTADQQADFAAAADAAMTGFLTTEPYASFADRLNFWRVDVASAESGAGFDCSDDEEIAGCADRLRENAFGSVFPLRAASIVTGRELGDVSLFQLGQHEVHRAAAHAPYDAIVVIVNTPKFGAFGMYVTSIQAGDDIGAGVVHESGHAFALLGDEYVEDG